MADTVKATSYEAIRVWEKMGVKVIMLTGDNRRTAEAVRQKLGISEVVAEVLPQDKEKKVSELKRQGHKVAMIGDGINDAPRTGSRRCRHGYWCRHGCSHGERRYYSDEK